MKKTMKLVAVFFCLLLYITGIYPLVGVAAEQTDLTIALSDAEQSLVSRTQEGEPLSMGIIPHTFPLSACPPDSEDYIGINVEMLNKISELSGLRFEYARIPLETQTPYQVLQAGTVSLVAGSIKLDSFLEDPKLVLSERLGDGAAGCIVKKGSSPSRDTGGKVAVINGYQAGYEFIETLFPTYEILPYSNNQEVLHAVRNNTADIAIISRYAGTYELQNPLNENLVELTAYKMEKDSCIMGVNTPENRVAISIINKALSAIGEDGYNYVQMNFSLTHPYKITLVEFLYKYRYILLMTIVALIILYLMTIRLHDTQKEHDRLSIDALTGAFTESGFMLAVTKILSKTSKPFFITDFDIRLFSGYNELHGKAEGDELLKQVVHIVKLHLCEQDVICRAYADHFIVLTSKDTLEDLKTDIRSAFKRFNEVSKSRISVNFGIYPVMDKTMPVSKMLDFAAMAKKSIKSNASEFIGVFNEELLKRHIDEAKMTSGFQGAIENKEFVAYYQPKFDVVSKTAIGAEALVRWVLSDGTLIPPCRFIELFEKGGQIQQLDFYMLEEVCILLSSLREQKMPLLPIAVNFSRVHLYDVDFVSEVNQIVDRYEIPKHLIEIECTETTMLHNVHLTKDVLGRLQEQGFSIAMDDFGSAYSSLNTLCSIPLNVLKLDGGFLRATLSHEKDKAKIIISRVIALAHDLSLKVVAEGVETESQYLFLKSLNCDFIQGYYFSKPLKESQFLELLTRLQEPFSQNID